MLKSFYSPRSTVMGCSHIKKRFPRCKIKFSHVFLFFTSFAHSKKKRCTLKLAVVQVSLWVRQKFCCCVFVSTSKHAEGATQLSIWRRLRLFQMGFGGIVLHCRTTGSFLSLASPQILTHLLTGFNGMILSVNSVLI